MMPSRSIFGAFKRRLPPYDVLTIKVSDERSYEILVPQDKSDPVVDEMRKGAQINRHVLDIVERFSVPGGRVADFGAHLGSVAFAAAAMGREVLAIDAAEDFVRLMRAGARRNGFKGLRAEWAAVGDHEGSIDFVQNGPFGQVSSTPTGLTVPMRTGAKLLAARGWDTADVVKIDIEGSEPEAFRGLSPVLSRADAPVIVYESNAPVLNARGSGVAPVRRQVEEFGYTLYRAEGAAYAPLGADEPQVESVLDVIALKPAHLPAVDGALRPALSHDELADRALAWSAMGAPVERLHLVEVLADPDLPWRTLPAAREALGRLATDSVPAVAAAALAAA
jgi:FkbM family methyltransferase